MFDPVESETSYKYQCKLIKANLLVLLVETLHGSEKCEYDLQLCVYVCLNVTCPSVADPGI